METIIPAVFDNRHEKRKWTIIPVILLSVFFVGIFLPIMIFIRLNSAEIMVAFILTVMACMTMYLWYHLMVPSFVILDHHFLILERKVRKEMIPLDLVVRAKRISNGVLFLKMADGKQIIRSGIDNMILYHLTNYIGIRNINCV
jgi:hypothetical protein